MSIIRGERMEGPDTTPSLLLYKHSFMEPLKFYHDLIFRSNAGAINHNGSWEISNSVKCLSFS